MSHPTFRQQRRRFLGTGAALGLAVATPAILTSCGGSGSAGDTATPPAAEGRELRQLNFDLSLADVRNPRLFALRSGHHGKPLLAHTDESRQRQRALTPMLAQVPDRQLTHYLEDVDLPAASLQSVLVLGEHPTTGAAVLAAARIHVPRAALAALAARRAAAPRATAASAKRQAYGLALRAESNVRAAAAAEATNDFATPLDIAAFLVFHHPEVMNLDATQGADILDRIETLPCAANDPSCTPFLGTLAFQIATLIGSNGYPSTTPGSWATLVLQTFPDGEQILDANLQPVVVGGVPQVYAPNTPVLDADGHLVYRYETTDAINDATGAVVQQILADVFDDATFAGNNWHPTQGIAAQSAAPSAGAPRSGAPGGAAPFDVQAAQPVGSTVHGVNVVGLAVTDATNRVVRLSVKNRYLRYLSAYAQFFDAQDSPIALPNPQPLDKGASQFLKLVPTNSQIMGIPYTGDDVTTTGISVTVPAAASSTRVLFGSLGLGGQAFAPEALAGSICTLAGNIGIPVLFLALGIGGAPDAGQALGAILSDIPLLTRIIEDVTFALAEQDPSYGNGPFAGGVSAEIKPFLAAGGRIAIQALLRQAPRLAQRILQNILQREVESALPIVGMAVRVLGIASSLAALGQTLGEVLSSPAIFDNRISLTMDTTVTISKDQGDFQFPASATTYRVEAYYDGGATPRRIEGPVPMGRADPIPVLLAGVPSGGKVKFRVSLFSASGFLAGYKETDLIDNLPATAASVPVQIVEAVVPLTATTQYGHALKLAYANNARTWAPGPAPTATRTALCQGTDNAICALNGITVHTASGMAGYGFLAGGQNVGTCGGGATGALNTIENVFLGTNPQQALKFPGCGYAEPVGIVYDPIGAAVGGHHFFLQPAADGYHVRSVVLDATTPFDMAQTTSWGRFTRALDSLAVHPSGYVVGIDRQNHKMEILRLPPQAVPESAEPQAVPFAVMKAGRGVRAGLLDTPVAVTVANGAILVLEQGNGRVQAFDTGANPVLQFNGKTSAFMALKAEPGVTYLDLGSEALGYLYVLSSVGNGQSPTDYRLDLYTPDGAFLTRTVGVAAARLAVDVFRNVYTLNYERLAGSPRVEPSLSQWHPSTPA